MWLPCWHAVGQVLAEPKKHETPSGCSSVSGLTVFFFRGAGRLLGYSTEDSGQFIGSHAGSSTSPKARTGNVPMFLTLTGTAKKRKPTPGSWPKPRRCSTIWDFGGEKEGMHGPAQVAGVIDVERVNAHKRYASFEKVLSGVSCQERMALEILVRAPVCIPAGTDQDRLASKVVALEDATANRPTFRQISRDHDAFQVRYSLQGNFRQVLSGGVAVEASR